MNPFIRRALQAQQYIYAAQQTKQHSDAAANLVLQAVINVARRLPSAHAKARGLVSKALALYTQTLGAAAGPSVHAQQLAVIAERAGCWKHPWMALAARVGRFATAAFAALPKRSANEGRAWHLLAISSYALHDFAGAAEAVQRAEAIWTHLYGSSAHLDTANTLALAARIHRAHGLLAEADEAGVRALNVRVTALGTEVHVAVAQAMLTLAKTRAARRNLTGAAEMYGVFFF
jgi:hypothetical protein